MALQLDDMVKSLAHPPQGQSPPGPEDVSAIKQKAADRLETLIGLHERMVTLGQSVYQVVEDQVNLQPPSSTQHSSSSLHQIARHVVSKQS